MASQTNYALIPLVEKIKCISCLCKLKNQATIERYTLQAKQQYMRQNNKHKMGKPYNQNTTQDLREKFYKVQG